MRLDKWLIHQMCRLAYRYMMDEIRPSGVSEREFQMVIVAGAVGLSDWVEEPEA